MADKTNRYNLAWLERMVVSKIFDDDPIEIEKSIQEIRALLDEDEA